MTLAQSLLAFGALAFVLTITPGIDTALALRSTLTAGRRGGLLAVLGIAAGLLAWGVAAALGGALLLSVSETAYRLVSIIGALYLVTLGTVLIVRTFRGGSDSAPAVEDAVDRSALRAISTGFATNLLNPKIGVFYVATLPQFIPADAPVLEAGLALAALHAALTVAWLGLIVVTAGYARRWLANARALRIVDRITGGVLIVFGARLLVGGRLA